MSKNKIALVSLGLLIGYVFKRSGFRAPILIGVGVIIGYHLAVYLQYM